MRAVLIEWDTAMVKWRVRHLVRELDEGRVLRMVSCSDLMWVEKLERMWVYDLGQDLDCKMAVWKGMGLPMECHWDLMLVAK